MKMNPKSKNRKPNVKQAAIKGTSVTLISSLLLSSCSGYLQDEGYNSAGNMYGDFAPNMTRGDVVMDISGSNLNDNFVEHMANVTMLIDDIIANRLHAMQFLRDPAKYISDKKYNLRFDFSEEEMQFLKAFTDIEVLMAINDHDFEKFIEVCKRKRYIGLNLTNLKPMSSIRPYFKTETDFQQYMTTIGVDDERQIVPNCFVIAGAVCYIAGAVFIYGAVVTIAAFWVGVDTGVGVTGYFKKAYDWLRSEAFSTSNVIRLWTNEAGELEHNILYDRLVSEQTNEITAIINADLDKPIIVDGKTVTLDPATIEATAKFNEDIVKANLEGYYGLRKL